MLTIVRDDKGNPIRVEFSPFALVRKSFDQLNLVVNQIKPVNVIKTFTQAICLDYICRQIEEVEEAYASSLSQNTKEIKQDNETITVLDLDNVPNSVIEVEKQYPHLKQFRETGEYAFIPEAKLPEDDSFKIQLNTLLIKYCKLWAKKKITSLILSIPENEVTKDDMDRAVIKQINYQADESNLLMKKINGEELTSDEEEYLNQLQEIRSQINNIRQLSNEVERQIVSATTLEQLLDSLSSLA